jgi:hypothetical protein
VTTALPAICTGRAHEAARWLTELLRPGSELNAQALRTNTHFDAATWQAGLIRAVAPWADAEALLGALEAELHALADVAVLPTSALVVLGGVLPPSHLQAVLRPWLLGADVLVKAPSQDPAFPALLAASFPGVTLTSRDDVPSCARTVDAVVVVGGDEAVREIAALVPLSTPFLGYGDRLSIGLTDEAPPAAALEGFADDIRLYDQRGCLSLRELWVRGDPQGVAERLAEQLLCSARRPPLGALEDRIRRYHDLAVMSGAVVHAEWSSESGRRVLSWCVAVETDDAPLPPGPGGRVVVVRRWQPGAMNPPAPLSSVAVAGALSAEERRSLIRLGASRFVAPGELQAAPPSWWHDQRRPFSGLCRYVGGS